jgi:hypothetical protein
MNGGRTEVGGEVASNAGEKAELRSVAVQSERVEPASALLLERNGKANARI